MPNIFAFIWNWKPAGYVTISPCLSICTSLGATYSCTSRKVPEVASLMLSAVTPGTSGCLSATFSIKVQMSPRVIVLVLASSKNFKARSDEFS